MKIALFDDWRVGLVRGEQIIAVDDLVSDIPRTDGIVSMRDLIERFEDLRPSLDAAVADREGLALDSVRLRPPIPHPVNISCMAVNYMENSTLAERPEINAVHKSPTTVIGDGDTMVLPDVPATIFEGEAELALVIGRRAENVPSEHAYAHVFGYTNLIDGSARGLPPSTNVFYQMKSRATFCPIGPWITTADEVSDPQHLQIRLWNNGELMQDFNTDDMAHDIARCVEFISSIHPLLPGDILATGTNHGGLNPFMNGDHVELEVESLGRLHISVADRLERTWKRETRLARHDAGLVGPTPQVGGKYANR
jgi:2-keto-4-pentenoate hydratase/2-oxohepta-3-ene-1,7-dioic acid hydratase in catechol pathway